MSSEQLFAWVIMAVLVRQVVSGWVCVRILAFMFVWQTVSPVREWYIDVTYLVVALGILEYSYSSLKLTKYEAIKK